ncbi:cytochrome c oxidase assembly protein COX16 homolog, mitochondrial-like [Hyalella azteca]|uniref:Cytochrome c oxidase assembly protein COX16 homolog, mitochondrial-like n=1 Tax=Hyalella azteca TaxID=294128 RepID=A0A979FSV5_HYAAZ|nr:cytochrome c oxidase assembly protein COX16 homolog, mitochondrial-like [Hyalella azteca]
MRLNKFMSYGAPLIILVVGGSLGLKQFQQLSPSPAPQLDIDRWENKRGPRPWEADNPLYQEAVARAQAIKEGTIKTTSIATR